MKNRKQQKIDLSKKLYYTIGEVSAHLGVDAHQIRYWEQRIPEISPRRVEGRRRQYDAKQIAMIAKLSDFINQGLKVSAARVKLKDELVKKTSSRTSVTEAVEVLESLLIRLTGSLSITDPAKV